jgi:flagellar biosynthesis/type III secretory pathway M-ring protein FliF/YscJ
MKKIILWSAVSVLIAGIAVGAFLWSNKPQVITLGDGTKLTLLGISYGKQ